MWTWARNFETPSLRNISIESEMSSFKWKKNQIENVVLAWMIYMKYNLCNVHLHLCIKQTLLSKSTNSAFRLYIFYHYVCSQGNEPTTFCTANTMLYHWATETLYTSWLSVQYNNKKLHVVFFFQLRLARCDLYYIFTVTDRFRPKKKKTREWEGMGVILLGFSPNFSVGLGRDEILFCGRGTGEVWKYTPVSLSTLPFSPKKRRAPGGMSWAELKND